jgi:hypothetical protein
MLSGIEMFVRGRNFRDLAVLRLISICSCSHILGHYPPSGLSHMVLGRNPQDRKFTEVSEERTALFITVEPWVNETRTKGQRRRVTNAGPENMFRVKVQKWVKAGEKSTGRPQTVLRLSNNQPYAGCSIRYIITNFWTRKIFRYLREHRVIRCADEYYQNSHSKYKL